MRKNGFTMVELLAVITIIGILSAVVVGSVTQYLNKAKKDDFAMLEKNLKTAVDNYFIDHSEEIPKIGGSMTINAQTLMNESYLSGLKDPSKNGSECHLGQSRVIVTRSGSSTDFNIALNYKVCVVCSNMKSEGC